jgi:hypothetical protein
MYIAAHHAALQHEQSTLYSRRRALPGPSTAVHYLRRPRGTRLRRCRPGSASCPAAPSAWRTWGPIAALSKSNTGGVHSEQIDWCNVIAEVDDMEPCHSKTHPEPDTKPSAHPLIAACTPSNPPQHRTTPQPNCLYTYNTSSMSARTLEGVDACVGPGAQVGLGLEAQLQRLLLAHDQRGRGAVREERRVGRRVRACVRNIQSPC